MVRNVGGRKKEEEEEEELSTNKGEKLAWRAAFGCPVALQD
jgi:hypothetical protein